MRFVFLLVVGLAACTYDFDSFRRPSAPLSVGDDFACAIRPSGQVACWGGNFSGQIGVDPMVTMFLPMPNDVPGVRDAVVVESGRRAQPIDETSNDQTGHVCVIDSARTAFCAGDNRDGQLGLPSDTVPHPSLVPVPGLPPVVAISLGGSHTCAVAESGDVFCWGANNDGQLGTGDGMASSTPVRVNVGGRAADVSAGRYFTCALRTDGRVLCWGKNDTSQIGESTMPAHAVPFLTSVVGAIALDTGSNHACALGRGGALVCWGSNEHASLGDGTRTGTGPVVASVFTEAIDAFTLGGSQTCVRTVSGRQLCMGANDTGQIGDAESPVLSPFALAVGPDDIVSAGAWSTCAMSPSRAVSCWGADWGGQLGDGDFGSGTGRPNPAPVVAFP